MFLESRQCGNLEAHFLGPNSTPKYKSYETDTYMYRYIRMYVLTPVARITHTECARFEFRNHCLGLQDLAGCAITI